MIRRLIILLLIVGCDFAPTEHTHDTEHAHEHSHDEYVHTHEHEHDTEHTHDGHYSCIHNYIYHWVGNDAPDDSTYVIDTLNVLHQPNINEAISECNTHYFGYMGQWTLVIDSTWCECDAGILY